ncbi:MAG: hypothetical protein MI922_05275 [Bacteroidales bacterium]|nr:hypothetical protein [Bacteroidales bacterium]
MREKDVINTSSFAIVEWKHSASKRRRVRILSAIALLGISISSVSSFVAFIDNLNETVLIIFILGIVFILAFLNNLVEKRIIISYNVNGVLVFEIDYLTNTLDNRKIFYDHIKYIVFHKVQITPFSRELPLVGSTLPAFDGTCKKN